MSILSLPRELIQGIARDYLPEPAAAALVLTCHYMFEIIGGKSLERVGCMLGGDAIDRLVSKLRPVAGPGVILPDEKLDFLQLLVRDFPTGYATYCHEHRILHIRPSKPTLLERAKIWKTTPSCEPYYRLPLGAKEWLSVAAVQDAARGAADIEHLVHYELFHRVTARHLPSCNRDTSGWTEGNLHGVRADRTHSDVTSYCRLIGNQVVLAMRYRIYIPKTRLAGHGSCAQEEGGCFHVQWPISRAYEVDVFLEREDLLRVAASDNSFVDVPVGHEPSWDLRNTSETPYMRLRLTSGKDGGVLLSVDMFANLGQGLRRPCVPQPPHTLLTVHQRSNITAQYRANHSDSSLWLGHRATAAAGENCADTFSRSQGEAAGGEEEQATLEDVFRTHESPPSWAVEEEVGRCNVAQALCKQREVMQLSSAKSWQLKVQPPCLPKRAP